MNQPRKTTSPVIGRKTTTCGACGSANVKAVLEVTGVPVFCNVLLDNAEAARAVRRGDIDLAYCEDCTYLFNAAFDESLLAYSPDYANSLSCSPSFGSFLQEMSERLVETHSLNGKTVLEVGCGDGDFLTRLCAIGNNRGFGFDPSYFGPDEVDAGLGATFANGFYSPDSDIAPDLISSRHVLEHVAKPIEFMQLIAAAAKRHDSALYVEVPDAKYMLEKPAVWDLIYEHPGYFADRSLVAIAERAGLTVTGSEAVFLDQFLYIDASGAGANAGSHMGETTDRETLHRLISGFGDAFKQTVDRWGGRVRDFAVAGKRAVAWGAGSKGVTFLNLVGAGHIDHIVDINPAKHGRFLPGSAQSVVSPDFLVTYRADVILLMNGAYEREVNDTVSALGINADVIVVD